MRSQLGWHDALTGWVTQLDLTDIGLVTVGSCAAIWAAAIGYSKRTCAGDSVSNADIG